MTLSLDSARDDVALNVAGALLDELAVIVAEQDLLSDDEYDPDYDVDPTDAEYALDYGDSSSGDINLIGAGSYALNAGMPAISWRQARKNAAEREKAKRAARQFQQYAMAQYALYATGRLTLDEMNRRILASFRKQARNAYIAGRRTMGLYIATSPDDEAALQMLLTIDETSLDRSMSEQGTEHAGMFTQANNLFNQYQNAEMAKEYGAKLFGQAGEEAGKGLRDAVTDAALKGAAVAGVVGAEKLDETVAYKDGWEQLHGALDQYGNRIENYGNAGEMNAVGQLPGDAVLAWWRLGEADHCEDCIALSDASPLYLSVLDADGIFPGSGHTRCGGNCHCELDFETPDQVCGDSFLNAAGDPSMTLMESAAGGRVNVWIQEADDCANPIDLESMSTDTQALDEGDAYSWDEDVQNTFEGDVMATAESWGDAVTGAVGAAEDVAAATQTAAVDIGKLFDFINGMVPPDLMGELRVSRLKNPETTFHYVWHEGADAIHYHAGLVSTGPAALEHEFTLRSLSQLSALAKEKGKALAIDGTVASPGMRKWLDALGAEHKFEGAKLPSVKPAFPATYVPPKTLFVPSHVTLGVSRMTPGLGSAQTMAEVEKLHQTSVILDAEATTLPDLAELKVATEGQQSVISRYTFGDVSGGEPSLLVSLNAHKVDVADVDIAAAYLVRRNLQDSVVATWVGDEMKRMGLQPNGYLLSVTGLPVKKMQEVYDAVGKLVPVASIDAVHGVVEFSVFEKDATPEIKAGFAAIAKEFPGAKLGIQDAHVRWYFNDAKTRDAVDYLHGPAEDLVTADEVIEGHASDLRTLAIPSAAGDVGHAAGGVAGTAKAAIPGYGLGRPQADLRALLDIPPVLDATPAALKANDKVFEPIAAAWKKTLTKDEIEAITQHQLDSGNFINDYLRKGSPQALADLHDAMTTVHPTSLTTEGLISGLDSALAKGKLGDAAALNGTTDVVYRGVNKLAVPRLGDILQDPGYLSASFDPTKGADFAIAGTQFGTKAADAPHVVYRYVLPADHPAGVIDGKFFEGYSTEREVMLPRDEPYRVVGVHRDVPFTPPKQGIYEPGQGELWHITVVDLVPESSMEYRPSEDWLKTVKPHFLPPPKSDLVLDPHTKLGGLTQKAIFVDPKGAKFLFKPKKVFFNDIGLSQDAANVEKTADYIADLLKLDVKPVEPYIADFPVGVKDGVALTKETGGNIQRLVDDVKPLTAALESPVPVDPTFFKPIEPDIPTGSLKTVKSLGGTTGAQLVEDPATGFRYVDKFGASAAHVTEEYTADRTYEAMGFDVTRSALQDTAKGPMKRATYIEGQPLAAWWAKAGSAARAAMREQLQAGMAMDALMANWDVIGLEGDNILIDKAGKAFRIDNGGALRYRAQGVAKGKDFGLTVNELTRFRDTSKSNWTTRIFGGTSDAELRRQIEVLQAHRAELLAALPADLRPQIEARLDNMLAQTKGVVAAEAKPGLWGAVETAGHDAEYKAALARVTAAAGDAPASSFENLLLSSSLTAKNNAGSMLEEPGRVPFALTGKPNSGALFERPSEKLDQRAGWYDAKGDLAAIVDVHSTTLGFTAAGDTTTVPRHYDGIMAMATKPGATGVGNMTHLYDFLDQGAAIPDFPSIVGRFGVTPDGKAFLTKWLTSKVESAKPLEVLDALTPTQVSQMAQHQVFDWLVGNDDGHIGQWLIDGKDGHIIGIDKDAAIWELPAQYASGANTMDDGKGYARAIFDNPTTERLAKLDPAAIADTLNRASRITDAQYIEMFSPVLKVLTSHPNAVKMSEADWMGVILKRKHELRHDVDTYYAKKIAAVKKAGIVLPPKWAEWDAAGQHFASETDIKSALHLEAKGPPISEPTAAAKDGVGFKPLDTQQYNVGGSPIPLNAPIPAWSGFVPEEPPLPPIKATAEELATAKQEAHEVFRDVHGVIDGKYPIGISVTPQDSVDAEKAGLVGGKFSGIRLFAKDEATLQPIKDYLALPGHSSFDREFDILIGYSPDDISKLNAYDQAKKGMSLRAGAVVVEPDGRMWTVAPSNKFGGYVNTWVKGGVDGTETTAETAVREMREETGMAIELDSYLGDYANANGDSLSRMYIAHRVGGGPLYVTTPKETYKVKLMTKEQAEKSLIRTSGKPDVRDQLILKDALAALNGTQGDLSYVVPADDVGQFHKVIALTKSEQAVPTSLPYAVPVIDFAANPKTIDVVRPGTAFAFDPAKVAGLHGTEIDYPASSKSFPLNTTVWKPVAGGEQKMYWKPPTSGGVIFWANSKKQLDDPFERMNTHVSQLRKFGEMFEADPKLTGLSINNALLDQVPRLKEMVAAVGAYTPGLATSKVDRAALAKLLEVTKGVPISMASDVIHIPTRAIDPAPKVIGRSGVEVRKVSDLAQTVKVTPLPIAVLPTGVYLSELKKLPVAERKAAFKALDPEVRDAMANAAETVPARIAEVGDILGPRPTFEDASTNVNARDKQLGKAGLVTDQARAQIRNYAYELRDDLYAAMPVADKVLLNALVLDAYDSMLAQEVETVAQTLGDHGVRHIVGDFDTAWAALKVVPGKDTAPMKAMLKLLAPMHDTGYLTPTARALLTSDHEASGLQAFEALYRANVEKALGKNVADEMAHVIETHAESTLDWTKDPVGSSFRLADNLALFEKEKLPALFAYVPGNTQVLLDLADGKIDLVSAQTQMYSNIFKAKYPDALRSQLYDATSSMTADLPKFTIGMLGGHLGDMFWVDDHVAVDLIRGSLNENISKVVDIGQEQFAKFAKSYGLDGKAFIDDGSFLFKDANGKVQLEARIVTPKSVKVDMTDILQVTDPDTQALADAVKATGPPTVTSFGETYKWQVPEAVVQPTSGAIYGYNGENNLFFGGTLDSLDGTGQTTVMAATAAKVTIPSNVTTFAFGSSVMKTPEVRAWVEKSFGIKAADEQIPIARLTEWQAKVHADFADAGLDTSLLAPVEHAEPVSAGVVPGALTAKYGWNTDMVSGLKGSAIAIGQGNVGLIEGGADAITWTAMDGTTSKASFEQPKPGQTIVTWGHTNVQSGSHATREAAMFRQLHWFGDYFVSHPTYETLQIDTFAVSGASGKKVRELLRDFLGMDKFEQPSTFTLTRSQVIAIRDALDKEILPHAVGAALPEAGIARLIPPEGKPVWTSKTGKTFYTTEGSALITDPGGMLHYYPGDPAMNNAERQMADLAALHDIVVPNQLPIIGFYNLDPETASAMESYGATLATHGAVLDAAMQHDDFVNFSASVGIGPGLKPVVGATTEAVKVAFTNATVLTSISDATKTKLLDLFGSAPKSEVLLPSYKTYSKGEIQLRKTVYKDESSFVWRRWGNRLEAWEVGDATSIGQLNYLAQSAATMDEFPKIAYLRILKPSDLQISVEIMLKDAGAKAYEGGLRIDRDALIALRDKMKSDLTAITAVEPKVTAPFFLDKAIVGTATDVNALTFTATVPDKYKFVWATYTSPGGLSAQVVTRTSKSELWWRRIVDGPLTSVAVREQAVVREFIRQGDEFVAHPEWLRLRITGLKKLNPGFVQVLKDQGAEVVSFDELHLSREKVIALRDGFKHDLGMAEVKVAMPLAGADADNIYAQLGTSKAAADGAIYDIKSPSTTGLGADTWLAQFPDGTVFTYKGVGDDLIFEGVGWATMDPGKMGAMMGKYLSKTAASLVATDRNFVIREQVLAAFPELRAHLEAAGAIWDNGYLRLDTTVSKVLFDALNNDTPLELVLLPKAPSEVGAKLSAQLGYSKLDLDTLAAKYTHSPSGFDLIGSGSIQAEVEMDVAGTSAEIKPWSGTVANPPKEYPLGQIVVLNKEMSKGPTIGVFALYGAQGVKFTDEWLTWAGSSVRDVIAASGGVPAGDGGLYMHSVFLNKLATKIEDNVAVDVKVLVGSAAEKAPIAVIPDIADELNKGVAVFDKSTTTELTAYVGHTNTTGDIGGVDRVTHLAKADGAQGPTYSWHYYPSSASPTIIGVDGYDTSAIFDLSTHEAEARKGMLALVKQMGDIAESRPSLDLITFNVKALGVSQTNWLKAFGAKAEGEVINTVTGAKSALTFKKADLIALRDQINKQLMGEVATTTSAAIAPSLASLLSAAKADTQDIAAAGATWQDKVINTEGQTTSHVGNMFGGKANVGWNKTVDSFGAPMLTWKWFSYTGAAADAEIYGAHIAGLRTFLSAMEANPDIAALSVKSSALIASLGDAGLKKVLADAGATKMGSITLLYRKEAMALKAILDGIPGAGMGALDAHHIVADTALADAAKQGIHMFATPSQSWLALPDSNWQAVTYGKGAIAYKFPGDSTLHYAWAGSAPGATQTDKMASFIANLKDDAGVSSDWVIEQDILAETGMKDFLLAHGGTEVVPFQGSAVKFSGQADKQALLKAFEDLAKGATLTPVAGVGSTWAAKVDQYADDILASPMAAKFPVLGDIGAFGLRDMASGDIMGIWEPGNKVWVNPEWVAGTKTNANIEQVAKTLRNEAHDRGLILFEHVGYGPGLNLTKDIAASDITQAVENKAEAIAGGPAGAIDTTAIKAIGAPSAMYNSEVGGILFPDNVGLQYTSDFPDPSVLPHPSDSVLYQQVLTSPGLGTGFVPIADQTVAANHVLADLHADFTVKSSTHDIVYSQKVLDQTGLGPLFTSYGAYEMPEGGLFLGVDAAKALAADIEADTVKGFVAEVAGPTVIHISVGSKYGFDLAAASELTFGGSISGGKLSKSTLWRAKTFQYNDPRMKAGWSELKGAHRWEGWTEVKGYAAPSMPPEVKDAAAYRQLGLLVKRAAMEGKGVSVVEDITTTHPKVAALLKGFGAKEKSLGSTVGKGLLLDADGTSALDAAIEREKMAVIKAGEPTGKGFHSGMPLSKQAFDFSPAKMAAFDDYKTVDGIPAYMKGSEAQYKMTGEGWRTTSGTVPGTYGVQTFAVTDRYAPEKLGGMGLTVGLGTGYTSSEKSAIFYRRLAEVLNDPDHPVDIVRFRTGSIPTTSVRKLLEELGAYKDEASGEWVLNKAQADLLAKSIKDDVVAWDPVTGWKPPVEPPIEHLKVPSPAVAQVSSVLPPEPVMSPTPVPAPPPVVTPVSQGLAATYGYNPTAVITLAGHPENHFVSTVLSVGKHGPSLSDVWTTAESKTTIKWSFDDHKGVKIAHIRQVTGPDAKYIPAMFLAELQHTLAGDYFIANPYAPLSRVIVDKKALASIPKVEQMLKDAGWKETKAYWTTDKAGLQKLVDEVKADKATWQTAATIATAAPPAVPSGAGAGLGYVMPKAVKTTLAKPSFIYDFDKGLADASYGQMAQTDLGVLASAGGDAQTYHLVDPTSGAHAKWSVSPSGKTVGWYEFTETGDAAKDSASSMAMLRKIAEDAQNRTDKFWVKPEVYDKVPGLRQLLLDAGGTEASYPKLGTAIEMKAANASKLVQAISGDVMSGLKVSVDNIADYLGFDHITAAYLFTSQPGQVAEGAVWDIHKVGKVTTHYEVKDREAIFTHMSGATKEAGAVSAVAQLEWFNEQGIPNVVIKKDVLAQVPKLGQFLIASGATVEKDAIRLDATSLNNVAKTLHHEALPEALGGAKLPYSVVDDMAAKSTSVVDALHDAVIEPDGLASKTTLGLDQAFVENGFVRSESSLYWRSMKDVGNVEAATVGQLRAAAVAQLRLFVTDMAQNANLARLDIDARVFNVVPHVKDVMVKYGATEHKAADGATYWSLDRIRADKLRKAIDAEIGETLVAPGGYAFEQARIVKWPDAVELTVSSPKAAQAAAAGMAEKTMFVDAEGNQWMFRPGETSRIPVTDQAVSQLALLLGLPVPSVRMYTLNVAPIGTAPKFVQGSLSKLLPSVKPVVLAQMTPSQVQDVIRHSVLDWVVANDDAHAANYVINAADDKMWALDKSRAWAEFHGPGDSLSRMVDGVSGPSLLNQFFRDAVDNPDRLRLIHPTTIGLTLRHLQEITDDEFLRIVGPVARAGTLNPLYKGNPEKFLADMLARKHGAASDFESYFRTQVKDAMVRDTARVPSEWQTWLSKGGVFDLEATPEDLWQERRQDLLSKWESKVTRNGVYDPHLLSNAMEEAVYKNIRSALSGYYHTAVSGAKSGTYGGELIRPKLEKMGLQAAMADWAELNELGVLQIVNGEAGFTSSHMDANLRKFFNKETGTFRFVHSTNRYGREHTAGFSPQKYVDHYTKEGLRNLLSTAVGTHVSISGGGGVYYYIEVPANQIFATKALGLGAEGDETMVMDVRPEQIIAVRPASQPMDMTKLMDYSGPVVSGAYS